MVACSPRGGQKHSGREEEQLPGVFFARHVIPIMCKNSLVHRKSQCSSENSTHQERDDSHDVCPVFEN